MKHSGNAACTELRLAGLLMAALLLPMLGVRCLEARQAPPDSGLAEVRALLDQSLRQEERGGFHYRAELVVYSQEGDSVVLRGNPARVTYREAQLEAAELVYRRDQQVVEARARIDSHGVSFGEPVLRRGEEVLRGSRILYHLEDEQGVVLAGRIQQEKKYYAGERIHTVSDEEFHVSQGSYTTCDYPEPHFDFYSPRIKVIAGEMAIARPVYLRIAGKRVFWVPFYIFSLREDRQSGILTPTFGRRPIRFGREQTEWELRNLGYYLAPNDYWDLTLAGDLRQRSGWLARLELDYAMRYRWDGQLKAQFENRQDGELLQRAWRVDLRHNQELSPTSQVRALGAFQSNQTFNRDNSSDLRDRLNRTLRSNLNYSKRWRQSGNSLNLNASQTQNLDTETFDLVLPEVSFRKARKPLWGGDGVAGERPERWFNRVYYDGNARLRNTWRGSPADTSVHTSADLNLRASSQHKPFSWLQVSPSLSETWRHADLRSSTQRLQRTDQASLTATLSQTFYGLFHPRLWQVTALRHVLRPNLSLNYQATRTDTGGGLGIGGNPGPWKQVRQVQLRLDNAFWARVERGEEEARVRLAQLNFSTAYDLERQERPLADLHTTLIVEAGRLLDTRLTMRSEFYDQAGELRRSAPQLKQLEVRTNLRYRTESRYPAAAPLQPGAEFVAADSQLQSFGYERGLGRNLEERAQGRHLQLSHYYSRSRAFAGTTTRSWLRLSLGADLGRAHYHRETRPQWRCDYSINYNLHAPGQPLFSTARLTSELLSIQRDFHDWTATLHFEPFAIRQNRAFFFKAQFRDIPQLKFERGDSRL